VTQEKKMLPYVIINDDNCKNRNILIKTAEDVTFPLSEEDREIVELLTYQFRNEENCAGLAAPQIGFSKRVIIFSVPEEVQNYRVDATSVMPETLLINPVYKPIGSQRTLDWEACFSVKDYGGEVERFTHIHYEGFDINGNKVEGEATGFPARLIQHEIGHLNGQLFIHLLKPNARQGNLEKIREIHRSELAEKKETYVSTHD
jgi:peptide deformylase